MKVEVTRIKQYNSTYKHVVMVNGKPVCIVKGQGTLQNVLSYLGGHDVQINDGKIKKQLDKLREEA